MHNVLQNEQKRDMLPKDEQIIKLVRRLQALPAGRHEIIVTVENGIQDWTVCQLGKVEK